MEESYIKRLLTLTKNIGGPDYTEQALFRYSKYGVTKKAIPLFPNLESDPVFTDLVVWLENNIDRDCILDVTHIFNYENIIKTGQHTLSEQDLKTSNNNSICEPKEKSILELKLELEESQMVYRSACERLKSQESQRLKLESYLDQNCCESEKTKRQLFTGNLESRLVFDTNKLINGFINKQFNNLSRLEKYQIFGTISINNNSSSMPNLHDNSIQCILNQIYTMKNFLNRFLSKEFSDQVQILGEKLSYEVKFTNLERFLISTNDFTIEKIERHVLGSDEEVKNVNCYINDLLILQKHNDSLSSRLNSLHQVIDFLNHSDPSSYPKIPVTELDLQIKKLELKIDHNVKEAYSLHSQNSFEYLHLSVMIEILNKLLSISEKRINKMSEFIKIADSLMSLFNQIIELANAYVDRYEKIGSYMKMIHKHLISIFKKYPFEIKAHSNKSQGSLSQYFENISAILDLNDKTSPSINDSMKKNFGCSLDLFKTTVINYGDFLQDFHSDSEEILSILPRLVSQKRTQMFNGIKHLKNIFEQVLSEYEYKKSLEKSDDYNEKLKKIKELTSILFDS